MALKPSLSLRLGQQLRMTPQLQQAIRLLQLSSGELELEIQEALDSNFMLESTESEEDSAGPLADESEQISANEADASLSKDNLEEFNEKDTSDDVSSENLPEDFPIDTTWDDYYSENSGASTRSLTNEDENYLETLNSTTETIQSHMLEQINLLNLTEQDRFIAISLIDATNDDGMLSTTLEELVEIFPQDWNIEIEEIEAVLHLIQQLDPIGMGSRDLKEYLFLQLCDLPTETPCLKVAKSLVENYLPLLGSRDYTRLAKKLRASDDDLKTAIALIKTLNPRPASKLNLGKVEYVEPDVLVVKKNSAWRVELNSKATPRIQVNSKYAALITKEKTSKDVSQMKSHLQEARWFIKSLQQRNDTLLKVAKKIVERQTDFLEHGPSAMKPLVLHDISKEVDLHESTVSRVTTQKYMLTPKGVFELKYFFSSHVTNNLGGDVSSTAIKEVIKQLVADENPQKPLSDSKLCSLLAQKNITVARRTIAKYRDILQIPPSNERKQLI